MSSPANILVICTDNKMQSPMAEAVLRTKLPHTRVSSAGLMALAGEAAYPLAVTAMEQCGIDIRKHRARLLDSEILSEADLVFVMKNAQKSKLEAKYRGVRGRVFRLGEWDGFDIDDPTEMNREAFEQMRKLIEQACTSWVHTFTPLR